MAALQREARFLDIVKEPLGQFDDAQVGAAARDVLRDCGDVIERMFAVQPVKIYPGVPICQIFYHEISGDITEYASDKYQNNQDIQPSLLFKELNPECEDDSQLWLDFERPRS